MPTLELATHYFGDDRRPAFSATVAEVTVQPLTPSVLNEAEARLGETKLRVRVAGISGADIQRLQGTVWTHGAITDTAGLTRAGTVSAIEHRSDDDTLEFILDQIR